jgi:hypothetical protein
MSRYSSLSKAATTVAEVENVEDITVLTVLECTFRDNHVPFDGERL